MTDIEYDITERYYQLKSEWLYRFGLYMQGDEPCPRWELIPKNLLLNVWRSRVMYGFVRNTKAIDRMQRIIRNNTARFDANCAIAGREPYSPWDELNETGNQERIYWSPCWDNMWALFFASEMLIPGDYRYAASLKDQAVRTITNQWSGLSYEKALKRIGKD